MPDRAGWLELAASGMDVAALAAAGWYLVVRSIERDRRSANRRLAEFNELKNRFERDSGDADRSLPDFYPSLVGPDARQSLLNMTLPADSLEDRGGEGTEAEELLAARMLKSDQPFLTSIFDAVLGWWERIWRDMRSFGWFRVPLLAPIGLVLFVLFAATCVIRLPVVAIGYLFDTRSDFRLRIVVLAFALGLVLQVLRATIG
jgi:hypothetical protein